jgi:energy-converting hydrogenase A subunit M
MNLSEQVFKIKSLIYELSPQSEGVQELLQMVQEFPELLKHMGFPTQEDFEEFVGDASYEEFSELRKEVEHFFNRRKKYFKDEMDEFERVVQDLSRNEGLDTSVDNVVNAFAKAKEVTLTDDIWSKLENTESNEIKKGEMKKVVDLAKKYNKTKPAELRKLLLSGDYRRPLIIKFGDRYHLVAGNTRLCTAAALGVKPKVLIGEI